MNQTCKKRLTRFVTDLGVEPDAARKTLLSLSDLANAFRVFNGAAKDAAPLLSQLIRILRQAMPQIIPLSHALDFLELDLAQGLASDKKDAMRVIEHRMDQAERTCDALAEQGIRHIAGSETIYVHAAGEGLFRLLAKASCHLSFRVCVADHNPDQVSRVRAALKGTDVCIDIAGPDQSSGGLGSADKLFFGPVPVTGDRKCVAPAGTSDLIRCCRQRHIPVYLFADTLHYTRTNALDLPVFRGEGGAGWPRAQEVLGLDQVDHWITELGEVSRNGRVLTAPLPSCPEKAQDRLALPGNLGMPIPVC